MTFNLINKAVLHQENFEEVGCPCASVPLQRDAYMTNAVTLSPATERSLAPGHGLTPTVPSPFSGCTARTVVLHHTSVSPDHRLSGQLTLSEKRSTLSKELLHPPT